MRIGSILSTSNQTVKQTAALLTSKGRKEQGRFLVEGANAISNLPDGFNVCYLFCEESKGFDWFVDRYDSYLVSRAVIEKVTDTVTSQGIVAVVDIPVQGDLSALSGNAVVLDGVMDSGNVGAIIRNCAAFGVENVLMVGGADPFSPKCVRASMGGVFFTRVYSVTHQEVVELKGKGYSLIAADMNGDNYASFYSPDRFALVIGSEAHGVSAELKRHSDSVLSIPIANVESLNAAVAAGILLSKLSN